MQKYKPNYDTLPNRGEVKVTTTLSGVGNFNPDSSIPLTLSMNAL